MSSCESPSRWLGLVLCVGALSLASASAQLVPEALLPEAPSQVKQSEASSSRLWFPAPGEPPPRDRPQPAGQQGPDRKFVGLVKRGLRDQKEIYSAPFHRRNLKWDALFLITTGGLIAVDRHAAGALSHNNVTISQHISDVALFSTMATTGALYLSGIVSKDDHARETGLLGFEALANTFLVDTVTQIVAGRERPLEGSGHGRFWVNNTFNSAFPSQHSGLTWSMASVLAHEYPRPWIQSLAYATATTVSVTRVTGLKHFPADVAVGGVFGYFIGQHIFHAHSHFLRSSSHIRSDYLDQNKRSYGEGSPGEQYRDCCGKKAITTQNPGHRVNECAGDLPTTTFSSRQSSTGTVLSCETHLEPSSPSYCRITP